MKEDTKNPQLVVDSIIDGGKDEQKNDAVVKVYPLTIRRYALLEKLDSPFIGGSQDFGVEAIIPAAYVMCTEKTKLKEYASTDKKKLIEDAFDWSEELKVDDIPSLVEHITKQLADMNKAAPDAASGDKKKSEDVQD